MNPNTIERIEEAIKYAFTNTDEIIIERYVSGNHYRITIVDDEVIAITQRLPANVLSDGKSTLAKLIEDKNIVRKNMNLPLIVLRLNDYHFLELNNVDLKTVYPCNTQILLLQLIYWFPFW